MQRPHAAAHREKMEPWGKEREGKRDRHARDEVLTDRTAHTAQKAEDVPIQRMYRFTTLLAVRPEDSYAYVRHIAAAVRKFLGKK